MALDPATVGVLVDHRERCAARCEALGLQFGDNAFVFSPDPDGGRFLAPSSLTQRYERLAARLGVDTTFHKLRHYSATELIAASVDVRTVASLLGHGGGGTTTLKAYAAWVSEADQRAAKNLGASMPSRPGELNPTERAQTELRSPYERIAAQLRDEIFAGEHEVGGPVPPANQLAGEHGVAISTARRALALLETWGVVATHRGRRLVIDPMASVEEATGEAGTFTETPGSDRHDTNHNGNTVGSTTKLWAITLRGPNGHRYPPRHVRADINQPDSFRPHLLAIARIEAPTATAGSENWIGDFELEVREAGQEHKDPEFTLRWQES